MLQLTDGLHLYHGSYCEVRVPDLEKCAAGKDFGRGFYITSSKNQAERFLKTSVRKAEITGLTEAGQNYGFISIFKVQLADDIKVKVFDAADKEWLHCVTAHRQRNAFPEAADDLSQYDIVIGKIADDQTNRTLVAYMSGAFGSVGSKEADNFCIGQLIPNRLQDQLCFRTERAIESLEFVGSEKLWLS